MSIFLQARFARFVISGNVLHLTGLDKRSKVRKLLIRTKETLLIKSNQIKSNNCISTYMYIDVDLYYSIEFVEMSGFEQRILY